MLKIKLHFWGIFFLIALVACNKKLDNEVVFPPLNIDQIPAIYIDTLNNSIVNEPKVPSKLEVRMGDTVVFSTNIGIEYRGSTSFRLFDQKSYGIELRDANGSEVNTNFLGFSVDQDFILYAPANDKSLLRNVLIYQLSNEMGMYAAKTKFVDLYLNGKYNGLYVAMEKIKRTEGRLNLAKMSTSDNSNPNVTGGYIFKIDKSAGDNIIVGWDADATYTENMSWRSKYDTGGKILGLKYPLYSNKKGIETYFVYDYPSATNITTEQKKYIQKYVDDFEDALLSTDFKDPAKGYAAYIDVPSFIDFFLLNELSHNPDAYRLSTFLNKPRGGKLKMGPIWDFNIAFGNHDNKVLAATNNWIFNFNRYVPNDLWLVNFWGYRLFQDPAFKEKMKTRWSTLRTTHLSNANINKIITDKVALLEKNNSINKHFNKWKILGVQLPFNDAGAVSRTTYKAELDFFKNWITARLIWMDENIPKL